MPAEHVAEFRDRLQHVVESFIRTEAPEEEEDIAIRNAVLRPCVPWRSRRLPVIKPPHWTDTDAAYYRRLAVNELISEANVMNDDGVGANEA